MADTSISSQIYASRDQTRNQIIEFFQSYLDLKNVDLLKSSFMSFMINILSTLTSNLMFYNISTYREFFLTTAQLPESILNLSAFLGYNTTEALYSQAGILITIPFGFDVPPTTTTITINPDFKFYAGDIEFITDYITTITVTNNSSVSIVVQDGQKIYNLPVIIETGKFSFLLIGKQYKHIQQEFQIDQDLLPYQFVTVDVPLTGQVSSLTVEIQDPGSSSWTLYAESASLYLMSATDTNFVSRRTEAGRRLYFGNGVIGVQPAPGSTVRVTVNETLAERGNVIAGSITRGDRIYTSASGVTKILNYSVVNPTASTGGKDEESLEEVRANSIASLTALHRLVSESDYINAKVVLENSPLAENSLPVLKRSDLKVNDIQLFTTLLFGNDLVPTRDASYITPIPHGGEVYLPRNTVVEIDSIDYLTLFDITTERMNKIAYYQYIMYQLQIIPMLVRSYGSSYNISVTSLLIKKESSAGSFDLFYYTTESDSTSCDCEMEFLQSPTKYNMTNDTVNKKFTYLFDPYTLIPEGELDVFFTISRLGSHIAQYEAKFTFRSPLNSFMMSEMLLGEDSTSYAEIGIDSNSCIIFDIPVVKKDYYDNLDQDGKRSFESVILQALLSSTDFESRRMLTDFTNLKVANTTGILKNMQLNKVTRPPVIDIVDILSDIANDGDRYILDNKNISGIEQIRGMIYEYLSPDGWFSTSPVLDDIIYVSEKKQKYIYSEGQWVLPIYQIPIELELEIIRAKAYAGSDMELSNAIKSALISTFQSRFGTNVALYRSEIIDIVHNINGVGHCRLVRPESSIFYNFDIDKFDKYKLSYFMSTEDEQIKLMLYGPEYTFFKEENITIIIL
jgi:hypothetical protein